MAGGTDPKHQGPGEAVFAKTKFAKQGDLGRDVLKKGPAAATWYAGAAVEVAWGMRVNHGGGYQYRLCPAADALTEECFQRHPLKFATGLQKLRYTDGSETKYFNGTYVSEGTIPKGSTWAMNPIPRLDRGTHGGAPPSWKRCVPRALGNDSSFPISQSCPQFKSPCMENDKPKWRPIDGSKNAEIGDPEDDVEGKCSGDLTSASIVDAIIVPENLPGGDYVLSWRWDCEETTQIWANCADVKIVRKADVLV
jgi:hypothetical protein